MADFALFLSFWVHLWKSWDKVHWVVSKSLSLARAGNEEWAWKHTILVSIIPIYDYLFCLEKYMVWNVDKKTNQPCRQKSWPPLAGCRASWADALPSRPWFEIVLDNVRTCTAFPRGPDCSGTSEPTGWPGPCSRYGTWWRRVTTVCRPPPAPIHPHSPRGEKYFILYAPNCLKPPCFLRNRALQSPVKLYTY